MTIPSLHRNQVTTPAPGSYTLFYDLDNGSVLTYKDSNCVFVALNELPCIDTTAIDDCICETTKKIIDDAGCALTKSLITATEYESIINNLNLFSVVTVDPSTGGYTHSITSSPTLFVAMTLTEVLCNGDPSGTATSIVTGGVGPYVQAWTDLAGSTVNPAALLAGAFKLTVTDANGTVKVVTFIIGEPFVLALTVVVDGSSATALPTGGVTPYTYTWNDNLGVPIGQTTQTATGLAPGTYQVAVVDFNSCAIEDTNVVIV